MIDIIIIVLRETLEASILISIMLSVSHHHRISFSWLFIALTVGFVGAILYAMSLGYISEMFDYVGQEVFNAFLLYAIYCFLILICAAQYYGTVKSTRRLPMLMAMAVAISIVREGGELVIFYSSVLQERTSFLSAATSGFIGLTLGMSAGSICYYSIATLSYSRARSVHIFLLSLIAAGMVLQATQLLIQADWLPGNTALWSSNRILPEDSVIGQVAYAVLGYESTPTSVEVIAYLCAVMLMLGSVYIFREKPSKLEVTTYR